MRVDAPDEAFIGVPFEVEVDVVAGGEWIVQDVWWTPPGKGEVVDVVHASGKPLEQRQEAQAPTYVEWRGDGSGTETIVWTFRCLEEGEFDIRLRNHWYGDMPPELPAVDLPGNSHRMELAKVDCLPNADLDDDDDDPTNGDPTDPTDGDPTDGDPTDGDPTDGDPTDGDPTDGDPTDGDPTEVQFDLYLTNDESGIEPYCYRAGDFERCDRDPVPLEQVGLEIAASPDGTRVFVSSDVQVQGLSRDPSTGVLTPSDAVGTYDGYIAGLSVAADGQTLLAYDLFAAVTSITKWAILPDAGLGDRFAFDATNVPTRPLTNPSADTLYVPLLGTPGSVRVYDFFGTDAAPTLRTTTDVPGVNSNAGVTSDGSCLFIAEAGGVHGLPLDADGTPGAPVFTEFANPGNVQTVPGQSRVLLDGAFVPDGELAMFDVDGGCALTPAGSIARESFTVTSEPIAVGDDAYVAEADDVGDLWIVTFAADGTAERSEVLTLPSPPVNLLALPRQ
jgi:hypothetical protein